jgi:flavorubredoxin
MNMFPLIKSEWMAWNATMLHYPEHMLSYNPNANCGADRY